MLDVAGVLAFAPRRVEKLAARHNKRGPDVLGGRRRHNGRTGNVLTTAVLAPLAERPRTPPEDGGRWTGAKVAIWMAARLGPGKGAPAARLGSAAGPVVDPGSAPAVSALSDTRTAS